MTDDTRAFVGMRVMVFSPDQTKSWGMGTITKVGPFEVDFGNGKTEKLFDGYPEEITLDSGNKTEGIKCYWHPISQPKPKEASQRDG
jgi:hypothetical protein